MTGIVFSIAQLDGRSAGWALMSRAKDALWGLIKVLADHVWGVLPLSLFSHHGCSTTSSVHGKMPRTSVTASWLKVMF